MKRLLASLLASVSLAFCGEKPEDILLRVSTVDGCCGTPQTRSLTLYLDGAKIRGYKVSADRTDVLTFDERSSTRLLAVLRSHRVPILDYQKHIDALAAEKSVSVISAGCSKTEFEFRLDTEIITFRVTDASVFFENHSKDAVVAAVCRVVDDFGVELRRKKRVKLCTLHSSEISSAKNRQKSRVQTAKFAPFSSSLRPFRRWGAWPVPGQCALFSRW